jgi:hypothetical protein
MEVEPEDYLPYTYFEASWVEPFLVMEAVCARVSTSI